MLLKFLLFKIMDSRRVHTPQFKLQVVLESLQRDTTIEAVCRKYGLAGSMVNRWRTEFRGKAAEIFNDKRNPKSKALANGFKPGEAPDDLKKIIGDLTVQNEILKKVQGLLS
jgi:transposase-like protein